MSKKSAGILFYRVIDYSIEILLVHPGGPYWEHKDAGAWSIPKGELDDNEDPLETAIRELEEETGIKVSGAFIELTPAKQKSGKLIYAWGIQGNCDPGKIKSNSFTIEWPPKSGSKKSFPEVDRAAWFSADEAMQKIVPGQKGFIEELVKKTS